MEMWWISKEIDYFCRNCKKVDVFQSDFVSGILLYKTNQNNVPWQSGVGLHKGLAKTLLYVLAKTLLSNECLM